MSVLGQRLENRLEMFQLSNLFTVLLCVIILRIQMSPICKLMSQTPICFNGSMISIKNIKVYSRHELDGSLPNAWENFPPNSV